MPITNELKSINRLEEAGFTPSQAKAVVEVVEDGLQRGFERFAELLDRKLGEMESRLMAEIQGVRLEMREMKAELLKEQRDQMLRFVALVSLIVGVIGTAVGFLVKRL